MLCLKWWKEKKIEYLNLNLDLKTSTFSSIFSITKPKKKILISIFFLSILHGLSITRLILVRVTCSCSRLNQSRGYPFTPLCSNYSQDKGFKNHPWNLSFVHVYRERNQLAGSSRIFFDYWLSVIRCLPSRDEASLVGWCFSCFFC